jgi:hypothetical protein
VRFRIIGPPPKIGPPSALVVTVISSPSITPSLTNLAECLPYPPARRTTFCRCDLAVAQRVALRPVVPVSFSPSCLSMIEGKWVIAHLHGSSPRAGYIGGQRGPGKNGASKAVANRTRRVMPAILARNRLIYVSRQRNGITNARLRR